ncbi:MAG TPA: glycoside hydrolase family 3 N-terminal domain-containing protein [Streptosporangiaceae bacterium]|nr:glycoside hydrolase family 3 N-terminal domain-containing protein [Streptosporangiaceae bacterium]
MTAPKDSYADDARRDSAPEPGGVALAPSFGAAPADSERQAWRDVGRPAAERVADLLERMTLEEKLGQLCSVWLGSESDGGEVAPHQHDLADIPLNWPDMLRQGLGQLTRPFGTNPLSPLAAARTLAQAQRQVVAASRFGIPAVAHDECLSGFAAWQAAIYPIPLAWGASFHPALVERMAAQIGASMRSVGVHQGLAPVLDVTVDPRWGRTEETIGEDPYLVATVGTAYVRGLESTGLVSTLKHFVGYSTSRGGRNLAPATVTPRQITDRLLPPFEMAIRHGGARSVMHSYTDIDGVPTAADASLLSGVLRDAWGFSGTVAPTISASASWSCCTVWPPTRRKRGRLPSRPALMSNCRPRGASARRWPVRCAGVMSTRRWWTGLPGACCCKNASWVCSIPAGTRVRRRSRRPASP